MTYKSVTLKVCEGCGTLWIRKEAKAGVYCAPCAAILQQFPDPKTRLRPGRPRKQREEGGYEGSHRQPYQDAYQEAAPGSIQNEYQDSLPEGFPDAYREPYGSGYEGVAGGVQ